MNSLRSSKAFSLALRPRPTLAAALGMLLQSLRSGIRLLTRLMPSLRSFIRMPKAAAPVRPPKGGSQLPYKNMLFSILSKTTFIKRLLKKESF